jgi:hypothetical protein
MNLNDLLVIAQRGAHSPRKSERIRRDSWLTINNEKIPIYDMSDKNLLGSIKGLLSTLPSKFLIEWNDTLGRLAALSGTEYTEEQKAEAYNDWLALNWFKYVPDTVISMAEEADDRSLPLELGESIYAKKTTKFLEAFINAKIADAKTDTQIKI